MHFLIFFLLILHAVSSLRLPQLGGGGDGGGSGGGGDGDGGGGGGAGEGGGGDLTAGEGDPTTKDSAPCLPSAKEKLCPKPGAAHSASIQPSPYESVMSRVHVAPTSTANGELEV